MTHSGRHTGSLYTDQFLIVCGIFFLGASVMAMFFQLQHYLESLGIHPAWIGFVIAADSLASFFLQPILAVRLNAGNGRTWVYIGTSAMAVTLLCYTVVPNLPLLIVVRVLHGAAFVCIISALTALATNLIPPEKSGQAFGLITVVRLVPYSLVPPLLTFADQSPDGFRTALICGALITASSLALVYRLGHSSKTDRGTPGLPRHLTLRELAQSFSNREIRALFITSIFFYSAYTTVFFFLKTFGQTKGMDNPGFFFTIANAVMIGVRILGGPFFDKVSKRALAALSMVVLTMCYGLLFCAAGTMNFYIIACVTGLGWGIAMPVLAALVFDVSPPHLRSMNLNLSLVMMQGGFFIGPFFGGLLSAWWGYGALFSFCAAMSLAGAVLVHSEIGRKRNAGVL